MRGVLVAAGSLIAVVSGVVAEPVPRQTQLIKRDILALFDSSREGSADATRIHRFAELPLNHLGYVLHYRDVRQPLPPPQDTTRFAGVLSWLVGPINDGDAYLLWLRQIATSGTRLVVLGELGATITNRNRRLANSVLGALGLEHTGIYMTPADGSRVVARDMAFYEFECRLDPVLPDYPVLERSGSEARQILEVQSSEFAGGRRSSLVTIGPGGGFAAFNYEFCHQSAPLHRGKWLIDPFAFFHAALGAHRFPVPDTTTISGRRMYLSIVDSDGWGAPVDSLGRSHPSQIAGQVVARELIEAFPDLPVTIDLREGDVTRAPRNVADARATAERVLALPQVTRPGRHPVASKLTRFDSVYDSISNLSPLATTGRERVFLASTSNERGYLTAQTRSPLHFFSLSETIDGSDRPRRLKPANINYHVSAATDRALLAILRRHLETARTSAIAPVSASDFGEIADGFFTARIEQIATQAWRVRERGRLQTVRFDALGNLRVDMVASRGVIGYASHGADLYVALDEAVDDVEVVLSDRAVEGDLSLIDSRWRLRDVDRTHGRIELQAMGYGPGEINLRAVPNFVYSVAARRGAHMLWSGSAKADAEGRLAIVVPVPGIERLSIEIVAVNH